MSELAEGARRLNIVATRHGGYIVGGPTKETELNGALFAGDLDACLEFIRLHIAKHYCPTEPTRGTPITDREDFFDDARG